LGATTVLAAEMAADGPAGGVEVTSWEIFDREGFIGVCAQTLLIQRRQVSGCISCSIVGSSSLTVG
jgi:hypothetical protein